MRVSFTTDAFAEYQGWQSQDRKIVGKINALINDIMRSPYEGLGKPEALKYDWSGYWSRRINDEHRLIYRITDEEIRIIHCRGHYSNS